MWFQLGYWVTQNYYKRNAHGQVNNMHMKLKITVEIFMQSVGSYIVFIITISLAEQLQIKIMVKPALTSNGDVLLSQHN